MLTFYINTEQDDKILAKVTIERLKTQGYLAKLFIVDSKFQIGGKNTYGTKATSYEATRF